MTQNKSRNFADVPFFFFQKYMSRRIRLPEALTLIELLTADSMVTWPFHAALDDH